MIIVIAGLIGSGKSTIAQKLSDALKIPVYSVDDAKKVVYPTHPNYEYFLKYNIPFPDDIRQKTFDYAIKELKEIAKKNKVVIVEETFHKKSLREPFFEKLREMFGEIILTLVIVDARLVKERLENRDKNEKHMVGYEMCLSFKKEWEPFEKVHYVFENNDDLKKEMKKYVEFIKSKLYNYVACE